MQRKQWFKVWDTRIVLNNIKNYSLEDDGYRPCLYINTYQNDRFCFEADSDSESDYIRKKYEELDMLFGID